MFQDVRKNVISLRPRSVRVEVSVSGIMRLYEKHRLAFLGGSMLVIVGVAFGVYRSVSWADSTALYPSTCLGGWTNPQLAQGKPDVADGSDASAFTADNAAVLAANASSDIFCGGFDGPVAENTLPTKVVLSLSWVSKADPAPAAPIIFSDVPTDSGADASAAVIDAAVLAGPEASSTPPVDEPSPEVTPALEVTPSADAGPVVSDVPPPAEPVQEQAPVVVPEDQPAADTSVGDPAPSSDSLVSLLDFLIPHAYAAEESIATESTTTDVAATSTDAAVAAPEQVPSEGFLEVRYTLDGNTWKILGTFDAAHISSVSFDLPLSAGVSWKDLTNLQVDLKTVSSLDPAPAVYLDGMSLQAEYVAMEKENSKIMPDKAAYAPTDQITLAGAPVGSSIEIYWLDDPDTAPEASNVFAVQVGTDVVEVDAATLHPGKFALVNTLDPGHCGGMSLDQCRHDPTFISETDVFIAE